jgi:hypothetical protein
MAAHSRATRQTPTISPGSASQRQALVVGSGPPMVRAVPPKYLARGTTEGTLMACRMGMLLHGGCQGYGDSPANSGHCDNNCHAIIRAVSVRISKFFTGPNDPCADDDPHGIRSGLPHTVMPSQTLLT